MGEFTGDYYKCNSCGHIWDYMDICPNCGLDNMETINVDEITEIITKLSGMLLEHGDLKTTEKSGLILQNVMASAPKNTVCENCVNYRLKGECKTVGICNLDDETTWNSAKCGRFKHLP